MHLMIDIETLGTRPGAVVTQIGLCAFDINEPGEIDAGLCVNIDPQDCLDHGMKADWSTIRWWMEQSREVQATLPKAGEGWTIMIGMRLVLDYIRRWGEPEGVWGNGPDFDLPPMVQLFGIAGCKVPWRYNAARDCRTLREVAESLGVDTERRLEDNTRTALSHNALADARAQARWVQRMWAGLPGRSANGPPTAVPQMPAPQSGG